MKEGKPGRYRYHLTQGVEMGQRSEIFVNVGVKENATGVGVEIEEVLLSGCAVLTMQGSLEIPRYEPQILSADAPIRSRGRL